MKQRVTALDLQILTAELQREITDYRLQNIYNISTSNKQYLLKFAKPDSKKNLVIDSGFKAHITEFTRPTPQTPSSFVVKLRKHLKTRRLSSVKQVGIDRIVVLTFSDGAFHLVLEFFSAGNIILLDDQRRILALQRLVEEKDNNDKYAVGETYNHFDHTLFEEDELDQTPKSSFTNEEISEWLLSAKASPPQEGKKAKVLSIQKLLYQKVPFLSADLIAKFLKKHGINVTTSVLEFQDKVDLIKTVLTETEQEVESILQSKPVKGYILTKQNPLYDPSKDDEDLKLLFDQFHPFEPLLKGEGEGLIEIQGYNNTLDKFFSTIESSKYALRIQNQENQAKKKLEQARNEKQLQVQRLIDVQEVNTLKGETIVFNADLVEEAKAAVQALINQGMDWKTIEKLIKVEQTKGSPIAKLINIPLNLKENKISLSLSTESAYEDDAENDGSGVESEADSSSDDNESDDDENLIPKKKVKDTVKNIINVSIDLGLSAYANASQYFTVKKSTVEKQKKVEQSATRALKNIEQKIEKDLKKNLKQEVDVLRKLRKPYFFEKFNWFFSNENYLIISGKDDAQTDLIYHRYINPDDVYVHADIDGSSHVFIINLNKGEISPSTLTQAGVLALSTSKAWDNKTVTSPWWSYASDISKKDYDGSLLKAGSFTYKKEKKFLPPAQLVMGFAFIWKIKTEENQKELNDQLEELENLDINDVEKDEVVVVDGEEQKQKGQKPRKHLDLEVLPQEDLEDDDIESGKTESNESSLEPGQQEEQEATDVTADDDNSSVSTAATGSFGKQKQKAVRGKKSKLKKIAQKYANQDEEERRLRMEALGTLKVQEKKEVEYKQQQLAKITHLQKIERRKKQEERSASKYAGEKEPINLEKVLNELVPKLTKEDEILEAIPVFAPWSALTNYRYRVKLQAGSTKKGKAVQEILHFFNIRPTDPTEKDRNYDFPREHEVIKALKDTELLPSIYVGKLKVLLPAKGSGPSKNSNARAGSKKGKKSK